MLVGGWQSGYGVQQMPTNNRKHNSPNPTDSQTRTRLQQIQVQAEGKLIVITNFWFTVRLTHRRGVNTLSNVRRDDEDDETKFYNGNSTQMQ